MGVAPWHEAISGVDILAVILVLGTLAAWLWLEPVEDTGASWHTLLAKRLRWMLAGTLALLTLTSVAILVARSIAISGRPLSAMGGVVPLVLMRTDFGRVWFARAGAVVLLWIVWSLLRPERRRTLLAAALALAAVVAYTCSATGHAADHGDFLLRVWMDWLHLVSAGLWGGVVIVFMLVFYPVLRRQAATAARAFVALRFSTVATVGLALVVVTGIYNAWQALDGWQSLWQTRYGLILVTKLALVAVLALLGATNRFWHVPGVRFGPAMVSDVHPRRRHGAFGALVATSAAEALLVLAIIAVVALLINGMPPSDMP